MSTAPSLSVTLLAPQLLGSKVGLNSFCYTYNPTPVLHDFKFND